MTKIAVKFNFLIILLLILSIIASQLLIMGSAYSLSGSSFNPGRIIDDSVFYNNVAMSPSQIQQFLNSKVPVCDTNGQQSIYGMTRAEYGASRGYPAPYTCLKDYTQSIPSVTNGGSDLCKNSIVGGVKSAATIIYDVAQACEINPQVLIVMLQKEMSLITDDWPWPSQYDKAMGYACPDSGPNNSANCNSAFFGFFNQVYNAAQAYRRYEANPNSYNYKANRNNTILWHPNSACGTSNVFIENQATASLYIYTPYRPNQAALNNLYGTGDGCSAYGNRNFWRLFNDWFGSTEGTPFFKRQNGNAIYMLGRDDTYYFVPNNSVLEAYGYWRSVNKVNTVSEQYINEKQYMGVLPTAAQYESDKIYFVSSGKKHHIPNIATLQAYNVNKVAQLSSGLQYLLQTKEQVSRVIKKPNSIWLYYIEDGTKRHITNGNAYASEGLNQLPITTFSDYFVDRLPTGTPMFSEGATILNSTSGRFGFYQANGIRYASDEIGNSWSPSNTYSATQNQLASLPIGAEVGRVVKSSNNNYYILDSGNKIKLDNSEITNFGFSELDFILVPNQFLSSSFKTVLFDSVLKRNSNNGLYTLSDGVAYRIYSTRDLRDIGLVNNNAVSISSAIFNELIGAEEGIVLGDGRLVKRSAYPEIYLVNNQGTTLHRITSLSALKRLGLTSEPVVIINDSTFSQYAISDELTRVLEDEERQYWLTDNGKRYRISTNIEINNNYGFDFNNVLSLSNVAINRINSSAMPLNNLIRNIENGRVYNVENGNKRWVPSIMKFNQLNYNWSNVVDVSSAFADIIQVGPDM